MKLVVFESNLNHENHPVHYKELRSTLPEHRRLSDETKKQTIQMLSLGAKTRLVKNDLAERKKKVVTKKDLQNLKSSCKGDLENTLESFVNLLKNDYKCSIHVLQEEETNQFKGIYFCNDDMKKSMEAYPEMIFMDGTYKLFKLNFILFLLMVQTGNGRGEIVGAAVIKNEDAGTLEWVARCFKHENSNACSRIRCFMSDKDLNERNAFIKVFPRNIKFYLCLFHTLRTFERNIKKMSLENEEKLKYLEIFEKLAKSETESQYVHFYEMLCETAPDCVLNYFNKNWHRNKEEWSTYSMVEGNYGNLTNNIVESTNKQMKAVAELRGTLCSFGKNFFALLKSQNQETNLQAATNYMKRLNVNNSEEGSIQREYANYLTSFAYKKISKELNAYKKIVISNYSPDTDESTISTNLNTYVTSSNLCNCHFFQSNNLPCRHIMAHRAFVDKPIFDNKLCANKWSKEYGVQQLSNEKYYEVTAEPHETSSISSPTISKIPVRSKKTASQRRQALKERANELVEIGSLSTGELYKQKEELLDKLIEGWRQGRIGRIVFEDDLQDSSSQKKMDATGEQVKKNVSAIQEIIMPSPVQVRGKPKGVNRTTTGFYPRKKDKL
ncbi:uncharacterized protein LOC123273042 isoform X2 [Cotesia glomerata]|nr:uncharacterized protein LOC123273042 isoform X2 [Cotesia glomerata]